MLAFTVLADFLGTADQALRVSGKGLPDFVRLGPKVVPFWGFIFRILYGNPKKELLWGLWVDPNIVP